MSEAKWALDRSQLDRQLLGDLAALISVYHYLELGLREMRGDHPELVARLNKVGGEIETLVKELWPTG